MMGQSLTVGNEARKRIRQLLEEMRAAQVAIYNAALQETERLNGPRKDFSVAQLERWRNEWISTATDDDPFFINICGVIEGIGVVPAQPRPLMGWEKLLLRVFRPHDSATR